MSVCHQITNAGSCFAHGQDMLSTDYHKSYIWIILVQVASYISTVLNICCVTQMLRLSSGKYSEADDKTLVDVLYQSDNFIVVNKRYDLKVNSDDPSEVTVASILSRLYPFLVDERLIHGFRFDWCSQCCSYWNGAEVGLGVVCNSTEVWDILRDGFSCSSSCCSRFFVYFH